jgi:hypothetical protein
MSTIYDRVARRKKLCELGKYFTPVFYNFITDFFTDEYKFDVSKFKDKVLGINEKDDLLEYIESTYSKQTVILIKKILAVNNMKEI